MRSEGDVERTFIERARRGQILAASIDLLAQEGYAAASLAAIAARIGVSKGVISYHFAGKEELLREVVTSVLAEAAGFMTPRVAAADSPPAALRAYVRANLEFLSRHRSQIRALTEVLNATPPGPDGAPVYEPAGAAAVEALSGLLAAGQRSGHFADFSVTVAARTIRSAIDAVSGVLRSQPDLDLDSYADDLLTLIERAVLR